MSLFSQRKGILPMQKALQRESMDVELRNRLWSAMKICVFDHWSPLDRFGHKDADTNQVEYLVRHYWLDYFKKSIDTIPVFDRDYPKSAYDILRNHFFTCKWWQAYDFLEFTLKHSPYDWSFSLKDYSNKFLQAENAAYRLVDTEVVEITDENEIEAVENALEMGFVTISRHLQRSLEMLSDRQSPDYRNSIKESISAIEATCRLISGDEKATLGVALKKIDEVHAIHPAFKEALNKLYGYTSDNGGIRHSLTEEASPSSYADAKFMLVSASAFINYLWTKVAENGLTIPKK